jgi:YidC/Oxa1 family membrane protein insertase
VGPLPEDSVIVAGSAAHYVFSTLGASLRRVDLLNFKSLQQTGDVVQLAAPASPLLSYRLLSATDTTALRSIPFAVASSERNHVSLSASTATQDVAITYSVVPDSFITRVRGSVRPHEGQTQARFLLVDFPETLKSFEADTAADHGALSFAIKPNTKNAVGVRFGQLDPGEHKVVPGPLSWVAAKNKYFMAAVLADSGTTHFAEATVVGGTRDSRVATRAKGTLVVELPADGVFTFELYTGPQQYQRLRTLGRDFENSNPYGGFFQGVVQPFATIVMRVLLWMKATLGLSYGWLLVIFGVAVRMILWPLNQGAMRTSLKMQRIQPEMNEMQKKYKGDPQKLQTEMMKLYKEHNMSPFSAFAGCLPILIPMPVLFALFFVFQNTIEFRGVPFLWLADISLKDPLYIVPLLMGISMFALSWIGLRNSPPNQQAKMMAYVMPVMMTVLFANFASGLNLYYAVQNVAALPQQWLIANERAKSRKT